jgi:hypothetical protein
VLHCAKLSGGQSSRFLVVCKTYRTSQRSLQRVRLQILVVFPQQRITVRRQQFRRLGSGRSGRIDIAKLATGLSASADAVPAALRTSTQTTSEVAHLVKRSAKAQLGLERPIDNVRVLGVRIEECLNVRFGLLLKSALPPLTNPRLL